MIELFYSVKGEYWLKTGPASYISLEKSDVKLHALQQGYNDTTEKNLTPFEGLLYRAQTQSVVAYAGPLAGHKAGVYERSSGQRLLVTDQCNVFAHARDAHDVSRARQPDPGCGRKSQVCAFDSSKSKAQLRNAHTHAHDTRCTSPQFTTSFIDELFVDGHEHVIGWMACAYQSLLKGDFTPGQMLALSGPPACGKSFFHYLVTELLGGRMAKPYSYLTGRTAFNGDLARAEHLVIEDEVASSDIRARRNFGSALKQFTVGEDLHVHDKGKIAFTAPTFKRLTLSVNDEPENMMILPPFDASITDKVMLLRCKDAKPVLHEDRNANKLAVARELPAFRAFLRKHRVPKRIACPRFGVTAFHNEDLLAMVSETQPETRLLSLIEEVIADTEWRGTATELEAKLRGSAFASVAGSLFYYPTACGVFLARLGAKHPDRFRALKSKGRTEWLISREKGGVILPATSS